MTDNLGEAPTSPASLSPQFRRAMLALSVDETNSGAARGLVQKGRRPSNGKKARPMPALPTDPFVSSLTISSKNITVLQVVETKVVNDSTKDSTTTTSSSSNKQGNVAGRSMQVSLLKVKPERSTSLSHTAASSEEFHVPRKENARAPVLEFNWKTHPDHAAVSSPSVSSNNRKQASRGRSKSPTVVKDLPPPPSIVIKDMQRDGKLAGYISFQKKEITTASRSSASSSTVANALMKHQSKHSPAPTKTKTTGTLFASQPVRTGHSKDQRAPHANRCKVIHNGISLWLQPWATMNVSATKSAASSYKKIFAGGNAATSTTNTKLPSAVDPFQQTVATIGGMEHYTIEPLLQPVTIASFPSSASRRNSAPASAVDAPEEIPAIKTGSPEPKETKTTGFSRFHFPFGGRSKRASMDMVATDVSPSAGKEGVQSDASGNVDTNIGDLQVTWQGVVCATYARKAGAESVSYILEVQPGFDPGLIICLIVLAQQMQIKEAL